jgi:IS30 family transposase
MRTYHQLTPGERYELSALRKQGFSQAEIARSIGRHRSTISREVRRNSRDGTGRVCRLGIADEYACWRRARSRRNQRFTAPDWALVVEHLQEQWSPEQIEGRFRRTGLLRISHETIYKYVWADWARGGTLYLALRGARKKRWKRYRSYDSRGRLAGKRHISERSPAAENRSRVGHLEGDTVVGSKDQHSILTLVDRKTGYVMIGKLSARNAAETSRRVISLIEKTRRSVRCGFRSNPATDSD